MPQDSRRARRLVLGAVACAAIAALLLAVAIALNQNALSEENGIASDEAFGPLVIAIVVAVAVCVLGIRDPRGPATAMIVLALGWSVLAVIGGIAAIVEPAVFNASYGCLGRGGDAWLAAAMRPSPATCGYIIPASDDALFYPAAFAAFAAAALGVLCGFLVAVGRNRRAT